MKIIMLSGGVDSVTLLHYEAARGPLDSLHCLIIEYGQKNRAEVVAAVGFCEALGVQYTVFDFSGFAALARNTCETVIGGERLTGSGAIPSKNLLFLGIATVLAGDIGAESVAFGVLKDDAGYSDCSATYWQKLQTLTPVKIALPFASLNKFEVAKIGVSLGVDLSKTTSCYYEAAPGCQCDSCYCRGKMIEYSHILGVTDES